MNIETREIRDVSDLTDEERQSGKWVRVPAKLAKKYARKQPVTDADYARIMAAKERRKRRAAKRLGNAR